MSTLIVTNGADSGTGSLRDTIATAQDGDIIQFESSFDTINLDSEIPIVGKVLTIQGPGNDKLLISGQQKCRIFVIVDATVNIEEISIKYGYQHEWDGGAILIRSNTMVNITKCILSDNKAEYNGDSRSGSAGAIDNSGTLTITDSIIRDNYADRGGGAIVNGGVLNILRSSFTSNNANNGFGGAIYNDGTLIISGSHVDQNKAELRGGAIANSGKLTITGDSTLSLNTTNKGYGGAIDNNERGNITIISSELSENSSLFGGAITNAGTLIIQDNSILSGNKETTIGGAIFNYPRSTVTITDSILSDNINNYGGAVYNAGIFTLINSRLSGNKSTDGGAVYNDGKLIIKDNSILSENKGSTDGGAIYNGESGSVTIATSTLSGNITDNSTGNNGGAVFNKGSFTITDKSILSANTAKMWGGAIYNDLDGTFTIEDSSLKDNVAFVCGAISNDGTLTITNSTLSGNSITSSSIGGSGAIGNSGTFTISACKLTANDSGAVYNNGQLIIEESTLSANKSYGGGGAIYNQGDLIVRTSELSNNVADEFGLGGAIYNYGTLNIQDNSTLSGNKSTTDGGAIYNEQPGTVTITASTISANTGINGGAIYNLGTLTIQDNSTLSGNAGATDGGAVFNKGIFTIKEKSTLSANTATNRGGAIYNEQNGIFTIADSHLLGNKAVDGGAIFNDTALTIASSITNTDLNENNASNSDYKGGAVYNNGTLLISASHLVSNGKINFCGAISNHGHLTIEKSTLSENEGYMGGAIFTDGTLIVRNCTLEKNTANIGSGGAVNITGYNSSTLIDSSTLVSNKAGYGGAICTQNAAPLTIINSTLSQNEATMAGDALSTSGGTIDIFFSTIVDNYFSATAAIYSASTTTCRSSILANPYINCFGSNITGIGQNLCTDDTCPGSKVVTQADLNLDTLAVNPPGTTATYALLNGSVALNIVEACDVAYDQRGILRSKSGADAGAYEKAQALLKLDESTSPEKPLMTQQFTYTINIHNLALVSLTNVTVTDKLPAEFDFITASEGYSFNPATREVTWPPATVEVDQTLTVTVTVMSRITGTFINSVTAAMPDYPTAIGSYPTIIHGGKMLAIDNEASPENPTIGYPFTYTINVRNTGQIPVNDVTVTDKLPDSVDIVTSSVQNLTRSGGEVTWTLGTLSPSQSTTLTLKVRPREIGLITNTITATSPDSETAICTYQTEVKAAMTFAVNIQTIVAWNYPAGMRTCGSLCALDEFLKINRFKLVTLHTLGGWAVTGLVAGYDDCIVRLNEAVLA